jgi:DnaJ-domain-containing protein 1
MAPRPSRRRRNADEPAAADDAEGAVDLGADEHAWWAQRDIEDAWTPHPHREPIAQDEPERDVLAEHFGADWRTSFGFDPIPDGPQAADRPVRPEPEPEAEPEPDIPIDTSDPYAVLGVDPRASWEEIVDAHRRQARRHHPDRLVGRADTEIARAEERIRDINVAYQELRVRRGK